MKVATLLKMWIWHKMLKKKINHHDGEQLFFIKKSNTQQTERCSCNLYIIALYYCKKGRKNSNLFDKNCTQTGERHMP